MRNFYIAFILSTLFTASAFSADIMCGKYISIPESALSGLIRPECVSTDFSGGKILVRAQNAASNFVLRLIDQKYNRETKKKYYVTLSEVLTAAQKDTLEVCGHALLTARIVGEATVVILFYDEATVVKWDVKAGTFRTLVSRNDPSVGSLCMGSTPGPYALNDQLIFSEEHRFFALYYDNETIRMSF